MAGLDSSNRINQTLIVNNMLFMEAAARVFPSLVVNGAEYLNPQLLDPLAELMISGNLLRGALFATPERSFYLPGAPAPMNTFAFLNTVITS